MDAGWLGIYTDALHSDIAIAPGASVEVFWADIVGDVDNHGTLIADDWDAYYDSYTDLDLFGDYTQSADAKLQMNLASQSNSAVRPKLTISGKATLDGTLEFRKSDYVPNGGYLDWVLHANGGVFGQFAHWTSPGLLIDGALRYDANNVWLELTRVSVQAAMASNGIDNTMTLASAGSLDRALAAADGFASKPAASLNGAQQHFLQSAGQLLWLSDPQQARRSLDSLAGSEHARLATDAQQRASDAAGQLTLHAAARRMDDVASRWSLPLAGGHIDGYDQWLGPRTLLGGSVAQETSAGDAANSDDRRASLYLHHRGERWQGTLVASAGRSNGLLQRRIDLADQQVHVAGAQRRVDLTQLHAELARPLALAGGSLQPYAALDAGVVRGSGFLEQGDTGFELTSGGGMLHQVGAAFGMRYVRDWRIGAQQVRLLAELQQAQRLGVGGQWQAAFLGVPDAVFDLRDWNDPRSRSAQLSLQGNTLRGWQWAFSGKRDSQRVAPMSWQLRFARDF